MTHCYRWIVGALAAFGVLALGAAPASAGRVARGNDPGFELHRIVSQYQTRTSESIAPWELVATQPIQGETLLFGFSTIFPEGVKVETWRPLEGWKEVAPANYTFKANVVTPEGSQGAYTETVIRFAADKVSLIQNAWVQITILPMPGPGAQGDVIEQVLLRGAPVQAASGKNGKK
jgi:hypothetical protein